MFRAPSRGKIVVPCRRTHRGRTDPFRGPPDETAVISIHSKVRAALHRSVHKPAPSAFPAHAAIPHKRQDFLRLAQASRDPARHAATDSPTSVHTFLCPQHASTAR